MIVLAMLLALPASQDATPSYAEAVRCAALLEVMEPAPKEGSIEAKASAYWQVIGKNQARTGSAFTADLLRATAEIYDDLNDATARKIADEAQDCVRHAPH